MPTSQVKKKEKEKALNLESITYNDLTWINIDRPTEREIEYLAKNYPFHPLDLDDCLSRIQRPKIDEYKPYLFLVFHFPVFNKETRVISTSQVFKECQIDEESRQENFNQGSSYLLYRIVDRLVDYCLPILNKIGNNIEDVEDNIFGDKMPRAIKEISMLRRDVISFRRIIWPMRAVLGSLEPKVRRFTKEDLSVYFGDMVDHADKIWDGLDEYKEVIEGLNDTHDSLATNRTNEVIRTLTIIATILLPLTLLASIYGMNIPLPFQESGRSILGVLVVWIIIVSGMLYFFRKHHWI